MIFDYFQLNDEVNVADSMVTRGVSYGRCCPEQLKVRFSHLLYPRIHILNHIFIIT